MRGAGEPVFEHDFPPGSDIVGDILRGPRSAERMEFELFGRLAAQVEISYPEPSDLNNSIPFNSESTQFNSWHDDASYTAFASFSSPPV